MESLVLVGLPKCEWLGDQLFEIINTFETKYFEEYVTSDISLKRFENTEAHNNKFTEKHRRWYHWNKIAAYVLAFLLHFQKRESDLENFFHMRIIYTPHLIQNMEKLTYLSINLKQ